jgi:hypothetical protein
MSLLPAELSPAFARTKFSATPSAGILILGLAMPVSVILRSRTARCLASLPAILYPEALKT